MPEEDPPVLGVLAGPNGPGWFPLLWTSRGAGGEPLPAGTDFLLRRTTPDILEQAQAEVAGLSADLHAEEMAKIREDRDRRIIHLESELEELRNDSEGKYQHLLQDMESQGYRPCVEESTSEAFQELKNYLKRRLPTETKDMLVQGLSGMTLPAIYGGGDAVDKACSLWTGLMLLHMSPSAGRMTESGRQMLTALIAAAWRSPGLSSMGCLYGVVPPTASTQSRPSKT